MAAVSRKRDEQVARRDFLLEIAVIALIGIEIILSIAGIGIGIREANQQAKTLSNIEGSTRDAASAMSTVSTSIKAVADGQAASLGDLKQMNESLQSSLARTGTMTSATQKQLQILQGEQARRLAQLAKKPKLELYISSVLLPPNGIFPAKARESTDTQSNYDVILKNSGDATATKGNLRVVVLGKGTWLSSNVQSTRPYEPPDSEIHTFLIPFDYLRPSVQIPMSFTIGYPKGQAGAVMVVWNVDTDELPTATPLGTLVVIPPETPVNVAK